MKHLIAFITLLLTCNTIFSQAFYRAYPSDVLGTERNIKVLKPRNYAENPEKTYPLIVVLDGDYLFEPVAGNVDYLSYWDQIPESFVLGINQRKSRYDETAIDRKSGLPQAQSADFMDFIMEVVTTMKEEYRIAPFTVIVGKDITANLATYFLMRKKVPFDAYLNIDPDYSTLITENLINKITQLEGFNYYYVATPEKSSNTDKMFTAQVDSLLENRKNVHLLYEKIEGVDKYGLGAHAIPRGLNYIFEEYKLIDEDALVNTAIAANMAAEGKESKDAANAIETLILKYKYIKDVYGIDMRVRLIDIVTVAEHLIDNKKYDELIDVADLAMKEYPEKLYGRFIEGIGYEGIGRPERAIKSYNAAYALEPAVGITKDDVLDKVEMLQEKK
ncbi:hypothetical protein BBFL7_01446 [Flavobacteria bacterium BBFL7]|nr:hypothetical protein BBFL7_01446 [Flavobacteria bacterium BBFL7]